MDKLRYWHVKPYSLTIWATRSDALRYRFRCNRKTIFEGEDFRPSPLYAIDGLKTVAALLTFLSARPGDTDREYFVSYTPEQLAFAQAHGEYLGLIAHEIEERANAREGSRR